MYMINFKDRYQIETFEINKKLIERYVLWQNANKRSFLCASTKTRGMVAYSKKKLRRQKAPARARIGSRGAPHLRGGGVAFGPNGRIYRRKMNKKERKMAIKHALMYKIINGRLWIRDSAWHVKTKSNIAELNEIGNMDYTLIISEEYRVGLNNIFEVKQLNIKGINVKDLLRYNNVILDSCIVPHVEKFLDYN